MRPARLKWRYNKYLAQALSQISSSKLKLDLSLILGGAVETLALFLRQQSRTLKQVTLDTLDAIVSTNGINMSEKLFSDVISETALLINDSDLHLSHLALKLTTSILAVSPASKVPVKEKILPKVTTTVAMWNVSKAINMSIFYLGIGARKESAASRGSPNLPSQFVQESSQLECPRSFVRYTISFS